jgi:E-phenylitaconyl-CoA hydratase
MTATAADRSAADGTGEVRLERQGAVAVLTIDRPGARNSLTLAGQADLVGLWHEAQDDDAVRAVVVTGAHDPARAPDDQSFCAGSDVKELAVEAAGGNAFAGHPLDRGFPSLSWPDAVTPVVAAVDGHCVGGGMTLVLATHLRVATPGSRFAVPELRHGMLPGNGGIRRAVQQLPLPVALELLLLGGTLDAGRAHHFGLINAVVPPGDLLPTALGWAERIATLSPHVVGAALELASRAPALAADDAARLERVLSGVVLQGAP